MEILASGGSLVENLVPQNFGTIAAKLVEAIAINSISEKARRHDTVVLKHRNFHSGQLTDLTNLYFRAAGIPIRFWSKVEDWQRWEVDCFEMLNGDSFRASVSGPRTIVVDKLPGESLWQHIKRESLTLQMLRAAAIELRRAHQFWSNEFRDYWSHGDASVTNVIYDAETDRARMIDFEIYHGKSLSAAARQADDLLVFLLDLVGTVTDQQWLPFATTFLEAYGDREVIAELQLQLALPGRLAWIWWRVRTNFRSPSNVKLRLADLSRAIANSKLYDNAVSAFGRNKRRASINCQTITPGIPKPNSRTRAMSDNAKPISPHLDGSFPMPSRHPTII
jgi:tRNA A-37 threonylcarbamoyl transferase component Bud32